MRHRLAAWLHQEHVRWRLARKPLRLVAQAVATALLALAGFVFLRTGGDVNETAASILIAVVFGVVTVLQQRQAQKRQHTVALITAFQSADHLAAADVWMASRVSGRREVTGDIPADDECHVITILDYYEFLAVLAMRGIVDTPLLVRLRGGTMQRCFDLCRSYIEDRRLRAGPELYRCLEDFAVGVRSLSPRPRQPE
ncbi:MAG TPA: hypothetical protein VFT95_06100 [Micromonosporaceae bacterium]|nr:hypothetical protein [Micromonosporaceae bacterium]